MAVDLISRRQLWNKETNTSTDKTLLYLTKQLYSETSVQIRCGVAGHLSISISTSNGVSEDCILATHTLCTTFMLNYLVLCRNSSKFHIPKCAETIVLLLLYTDDSVLLSQNQVGLEYLLN